MSQGPPPFTPGHEIASKIYDKVEEKLDDKSAKESSQGGEPVRIDPHLEPKSFFWDTIILYLTSAILGLSVSNIVVDFVRPEPNVVSCYTAPNTTRDQAAYINNYCNDYLPFSENFTFALVVHGFVLLAPHYLWKVYFSARMDFFFSHAAKLETLRNRDTGQYPHKNFNVVEYMDREFSEKRDILIGYVTKLLVQICVLIIALTISAVIFRNFDIEFDCPDENKPDHLLFQRVKCSYAKLRFVSVLRWVDYTLISVSLMVLLYGLYWCLLQSHPELEHEDTSMFCYQSCINSKYYKVTGWYQLKNDQHFLLLSLFATNAGLGRVFKSVQIATIIRHELSAHLESLDNFESMRCSERQDEMEQNVLQTFTKDKSFDKIMFKICKGIRTEQLNKFGDDKFNSFRMGALDIACGYHSYLFSIARWQLQVISVVLDPYYNNETEIFKSDEHHAGVKIMRLPTNLFGLPTKHKFDFSTKIELYTGYKQAKKPTEAKPNQPTRGTELDHYQPIKEVNIKPDNRESKPPSNKNVSKLSLVVIGPLDQKRKVNTVNQIIEMHSRACKYFEEGSVMVILRPLEVQGKDISKSFIEWEPESTKFWKKSVSSLNDLRRWFQDDEEEEVIAVDQSNQNCGRIVVKCGEQKCKFEVKTFYHSTENDHKTPVVTSSPL